MARLMEHPDPLVRFWSHIVPHGFCLQWQGAPDKHGYGEFRIGKKLYRAHRWFYEQTVGALPAGVDLDHLCRNKICANPQHLDAVSHRENVLRGVGFVAVQAARTRCLRGHALDGENLYLQGRHRSCRTCRKLHKTPEWRARSKHGTPFVSGQETSGQ